MPKRKRTSEDSGPTSKLAKTLTTEQVNTYLSSLGLDEQGAKLSEQNVSVDGRALCFPRHRNLSQCRDDSTDHHNHVALAPHRSRFTSP